MVKKVYTTTNTQLHKGKRISRNNYMRFVRDPANRPALPDIDVEKRSFMINNSSVVQELLTFLPGVKITGHHVVLGGAVLTSDISESYVLVAGCPAKIIKKLKWLGYGNTDFKSVVARMKKIIFVIGKYMNGGVARHSTVISNYLAQSGYCVTLL